MEQQLQEQDRAQQATAPSQGPEHSHEGSSYVEDTQNYHYDHGDLEDGERPMSRTGQHRQHGMANGDVGYEQERGYGHQPQEHSAYQYQQSQFDDPGRSEGDDMW